MDFQMELEVQSSLLPFSRRLHIAKSKGGHMVPTNSAEIRQFPANNYPAPLIGVNSRLSILSNANPEAEQVIVIHMVRSRVYSPTYCSLD